MLLAVCARSSLAAHQITAWPENKNGAVSISFDDGCQSQVSVGIPALNARGLKGTFYIVTSDINDNDGYSPPWATWRSVANQGHEIGSHTITHPDLTTLSSTQIQNELSGSKTVIDNQIASQKVVSLAYPYGESNSTVQNIAQNIYIGARGVQCSLNIAPFDFYDLSACAPDEGDDIYSWADSAVSQRGWLVVYLHTLNDGIDGCYGSYDIDLLTTYLDYIRSPSRNLWIGPVGTALKYIRERAAATISVVSSASDLIVLNLTDTLNNAIYNQFLTLRSDVPSSWARVRIQQGSTTTEVNSVVEGAARVVYYNAIPDSGFISLSNPQNPTITSLTPNSATVGGPAFSLTVTGSNFVNGATVRWNGSNRTTTFVSATQLQAAITAANIAAKGTFPVTVLNPDGGLSNAANFEVKAPAPVVADLSPSVAIVGGPAFPLTVTGSNFVNGATVRWNGSNRTTTFVSATQLRAAVTAADIAAAGTFPITVINPDGGVSNTMSFPVWGPLPVVTSLTPSYATVGGAAFPLTVTGSNFVNGATVRWNGSNRTTTFVSATQLQAAVGAADIAAAGSFPVTVINPDGGLSGAMSFEVRVPPPAMIGLSPSFAIAGGAAFPLTVTGSNFVTGATVRWNGSSRTTTFVSATQLQAAVGAADIAAAGTIPVTVRQPRRGSLQHHLLRSKGSVARRDRPEPLLRDRRRRRLPPDRDGEQLRQRRDGALERVEPDDHLRVGDPAAGGRRRGGHRRGGDVPRHRAQPRRGSLQRRELRGKGCARRDRPEPLLRDRRRRRLPPDGDGEQLRHRRDGALERVEPDDHLRVGDPAAGGRRRGGHRRGGDDPGHRAQPRRGSLQRRELRGKGRARRDRPEPLFRDRRGPRLLPDRDGEQLRHRRDGALERVEPDDHLRVGDPAAGGRRRGGHRRGGDDPRHGGQPRRGESPTP